MSKNEVPIWNKYTLTIEEASSYFNIGDKKLRSMVKEYQGKENDFSISNGKKYLINKKKLEEFLDKVSSI